jgi:endonuclease-8
LWGSYRINEDIERTPRLSLQFSNGKLNLYSCSVRLIEENLDLVYDWTADVLNKKWDPARALKKLKQNPDALACDVLLEQDIFAGVGNIIKNEVLFRIRVHPLSVVGKMPSRKRKQMVSEAVNYSKDFLAWKRDFVLRKHWLVHRKKICPRCNLPIRLIIAGEKKRRTFFCDNCQVLYN